MNDLEKLLAPDAKLDLTGAKRRASSTNAPPIAPITGAEAVCRWLMSSVGVTVELVL